MPCRKYRLHAVFFHHPCFSTIPAEPQGLGRAGWLPPGGAAVLLSKELPVPLGRQAGPDTFIQIHLTCRLIHCERA